MRGYSFTLNMNSAALIWSTSSRTVAFVVLKMVCVYIEVDHLGT